jgi:hypothetical protein
LNAGVPPTPNKATRGRGGLFLKGRPIHVDKALGFWKYQDDHTAVPDEEFWHSQKATRPPDGSVLYKPTDTRYRNTYKVWFDKRFDCWVTRCPELEYVEDAAFQSPYFIPGKSENLPAHLRPVLEVSPLTTPRLKSTVVSSSTYRAPESSESESKPSDKEVDQQLEDSSDQASESVLSPLAGLSLIAQGKLKELDPEPSEPHRKPDPFDDEFEDAEEPEKSDEPEEDLKEPSEPSDPGSPIPPGGPIPDPPTMAAPTPTSLLGTCPSFKGKRKSAKEFMTNIELYFNMNEQRISMNQLKILLALQHISEDAQQWKENEKTDLDDDTNVDKQWNDWTGFKTRFLRNWEELDSPGNAFSELLKLNK